MSKNGSTRDEIANELGVSRHTVNDYLRKSGNGRTYRNRADTIRRVEKMVSQGRPLMEIVSRLKVTAATVKIYMKEIDAMEKKTCPMCETKVTKLETFKSKEMCADCMINYDSIDTVSLEHAYHNLSVKRSHEYGGFY